MKSQFQNRLRKPVSLFTVISLLSLQVGVADIFRLQWDPEPGGEWNQQLKDQKEQELNRLNQILNFGNRNLANQVINGMLDQAQLQGVAGPINLEFDVNGDGQIIGINFSGPGLADDFIAGVLQSIPSGSLVGQNLTHDTGDLDRDDDVGELLSAEYQWQFTTGSSSFDVAVSQTFQNGSGNVNRISSQTTTVIETSGDGRIVTTQLIKYSYDEHGRIATVNTTTTDDAGTVTTSWDIRSSDRVGEFLETLQGTEALSSLMEEYGAATVGELEQVIMDQVGYDERTGQLTGRFVISTGPGRDGLGTVEAITDSLNALNPARRQELFTRYNVDPADYADAASAIAALAGAIFASKEMIQVNNGGSSYTVANSVRELTTAAVEQTEYDAHGRIGLIHSVSVTDDGRVQETFDLRDPSRVNEFLDRLTTEQIAALYRKYAEEGVPAGNRQALVAAIANDIGYLTNNDGTPTGQLKGRMVIATSQNRDGVGLTLTTETEVNIEETSYDEHGRIGLIVTTTVNDTGDDPTVRVDLRDARRINEVLQRYGVNADGAAINVSQLNLANIGYESGTGQLRGRLVITRGPTRDSATGAIRNSTRISMETTEYDQHGRIGLVVTELVTSEMAGIADAQARPTVTVDLRDPRRIGEISGRYGAVLGNLDVSDIGYDPVTGQLAGRLIISQEWTADGGASGQLTMVVRTSVEETSYDEHGRVGMRVTTTVSGDRTEPVVRAELMDGRRLNEFVQRFGDRLALQAGELLRQVGFNDVSDEVALGRMQQFLGYDNETGQLRGRLVITSGSTRDDATPTGQLRDVTTISLERTEYDEHGRVGLLVTATHDSTQERITRTIDVRDSRQVASVISTFGDINLTATAFQNVANRVGYDPVTGQLKGRLVVSQGWSNDGAAGYTQVTTVELEETQYDQHGRIGLIVRTRQDDSGARPTVTYDLRDPRRINEFRSHPSFAGVFNEGQLVNAMGVPTGTPIESLVGYDPRTGQLKGRLLLSLGSTRDNVTGQVVDTKTVTLEQTEYDNFGRIGLIVSATQDGSGALPQTSIDIRDRRQVANVAGRFAEVDAAFLATELDLTRIGYDQATGQLRGRLLVSQSRNRDSGTATLTLDTQVTLEETQYDQYGRIGMLIRTTIDDASLGNPSAVPAVEIELRDPRRLNEIRNDPRFQGIYNETAIRNEMALPAGVGVADVLGYDSVTGQLKGRLRISIGTTRDSTTGEAIRNLTTFTLEQNAYDEHGRLGLVISVSQNNSGERPTRFIDIRDADMIQHVAGRFADVNTAQLQSRFNLGQIGFDSVTGQLRGRLLISDTLTLDGDGGQYQLVTNLTLEETRYDSFGRVGALIRTTYDDDSIGNTTARPTVTAVVRDARWLGDAAFMAQFAEGITLNDAAIAAIRSAMGLSAGNSLADIIGYDPLTGQLIGSVTLTQTPTKDGVNSSIQTHTSATIEKVEYDQHGRAGLRIAATVDDSGIQPTLRVELTDSRRTTEVLNKYGDNVNTSQMDLSGIGYDPVTGQVRGRLVVTQGPTRDGSGTVQRITQITKEDISYNAAGRISLILRQSVDDASTHVTRSADVRDIAHLSDPRVQAILGANYNEQVLLNQLRLSQGTTLGAVLGYDPVSGQLKGRLLISQSSNVDGATGNVTTLSTVSLEKSEYDEHGRIGLQLTSTIDAQGIPGLTVDLRDNARKQEILNQYGDGITLVDAAGNPIDLNTVTIGYDPATGQLTSRLLINRGPGRDGRGSLTWIADTLDMLNQGALNTLFSAYNINPTGPDAKATLAAAIFGANQMILINGDVITVVNALRDITQISIERTEYDDHERIGLVRTESVDDAGIWTASTELRDPRRVNDLLTQLNRQQLNALASEFGLPPVSGETDVALRTRLSGQIQPRIGYDSQTGQLNGRLMLDERLTRVEGSQASPGTVQRTRQLALSAIDYDNHGRVGLVSTTSVRSDGTAVNSWELRDRERVAEFLTMLQQKVDQKRAGVPEAVRGVHQINRLRELYGLAPVADVNHITPQELQELAQAMRNGVGYHSQTGQLMGRVTVNQGYTNANQVGTNYKTYDVVVSQTEYDQIGRVGLMEEKRVGDDSTFSHTLRVRDARRLAQALSRENEPNQPIVSEGQLNSLVREYGLQLPAGAGRAQKIAALSAAISSEIGYDSATGQVRGEFTIQLLDNSDAAGSIQNITQKLGDIRALGRGDWIRTQYAVYGVTTDAALAEALHRAGKLVNFDRSANGLQIEGNPRIEDAIVTTLDREITEYDIHGRAGLIRQITVNDDATVEGRFIIRDPSRLVDSLRILESQGATEQIAGLMAQYDLVYGQATLEQLAQAMLSELQRFGRVLGYDLRTGQLIQEFQVVIEPNRDDGASNPGSGAVGAIGLRMAAENAVMNSNSSHTMSFRNVVNFFDDKGRLGRRVSQTVDDGGAPLKIDEIYLAAFLDPRNEAHLPYLGRDVGGQDLDRDGNGTPDRNEIGYDSVSGQIMTVLRIETRPEVDMDWLNGLLHASGITYETVNGWDAQNGMVIQAGQTAGFIVSSGQFITLHIPRSLLDLIGEMARLGQGTLDFAIRSNNGTSAASLIDLARFVLNPDSPFTAPDSSGMVSLRIATTDIRDHFGIGVGNENTQTFSIQARFTPSNGNVQYTQVGGNFRLQVDPQGMLAAADDGTAIQGAQIQMLDIDGNQIGLINDPGLIPAEDLASAEDGSLISAITGFFRGGIIGNIIEGMIATIRVVADGFKTLVLRGIEITKEIIANGLNLGILQMLRGDSVEQVVVDHFVPVAGTTDGLFDFTHDGVFDGADMGSFAMKVGTREGDENWNSDYDLVADGVIDEKDFNVFKSGVTQFYGVDRRPGSSVLIGDLFFDDTSAAEAFTQSAPWQLVRILLIKPSSIFLPGGDRPAGQSETVGGQQILNTADVNRDGQIDIVDMVLGARLFGTSRDEHPDWDRIGQYDLNGDETVNIVDLVQLAGLVGMKEGDEGWDSRFDLDQDGEINQGDLEEMANFFGTVNVNPDWQVRFDVDNDGVITLNDLVMIGLNYTGTFRR